MLFERDVNNEIFKIYDASSGYSGNWKRFGDNNIDEDNYNVKTLLKGQYVKQFSASSPTVTGSNARLAPNAFRAKLATPVISYGDNLIVYYQVKDINGNTRTSAFASGNRPIIRLNGGGATLITCDAHDDTGIGKCSSTNPSGISFNTENDVSLEIYSPFLGSSIALGSVTILRKPTWVGTDWGAHTTSGPTDTTWGIQLDHKQIYIPLGASNTTVSVPVKFKSFSTTNTYLGSGRVLINHPSACSYTDTVYNSPAVAFSVSTPATFTQNGHTYNFDINTQRQLAVEVPGAGVNCQTTQLILTARFSCPVGTHSFGIIGLGAGDSSANDVDNSYIPLQSIFAGTFDPTSNPPQVTLGNLDDYSAYASVTVVSNQVRDVYAATSDGKWYVNNFHYITGGSLTFSLKLYRFTQDPSETDPDGDACSTSCDPSISNVDGAQEISPADSYLNTDDDDWLSIYVRYPTNVSIVLSSTTSRKISCDGNEFIPVEFRIMVEDPTVAGEFLDMTYKFINDVTVTAPGNIMTGGTPVQKMNYIYASSAGTVTVSAQSTSASITFMNEIQTTTLYPRVFNDINSSGAAQQVFTQDTHTGVAYLVGSADLGAGTIYFPVLHTGTNATSPAGSSIILTQMSDAFGSYLQVSIVSNSFAQSTCADNTLFTMGIQGCSDSYQPPLNLDLPYPIQVQSFTVSKYQIAEKDSFAHAVNYQNSGKASAFTLEMSEGSAKNVLSDVQLSEVGTSCLTINNGVSPPTYTLAGTCASDTLNLKGTVIFGTPILKQSRYQYIGLEIRLLQAVILLHLELAIHHGVIHITSTTV